MDRIYWHQQIADKPLFSDLLWSRPEHKKLAGKLLIVGGNTSGFASVAQAYQSALQAGIGNVRLVLPQALQKAVGQFFENGEYAASTPSGSFSKSALGEILPQAAWADGLMLAGDFGRNSETAIMIENLLAKYDGLMVLTGDSLTALLKRPDILLNRPNTTAVLSFSQLQQLASQVQLPSAITSSMAILQLVDLMHGLSSKQALSIIVVYSEHVIVAHAGQISTTSVRKNYAGSEIVLAAKASVWQIQQPTKPFEALTTSLIAD